MADDETQDRLAEAEVAFPGRNPRAVTFGDRVLIALEPTDGQVAVMARLGKSGRMDDMTRVAGILDLMELLLADPEDKTWLSSGLLGGEMGFGTGDDTGSDLTAMGLLRAIMAAHRPEPTNREERRTAAKKAVRKTTR
jgi:hypothetical protein